MKTRAKGAQVQKAKAPDPGAYSEDDITPEDRKRAKDAKAQAADGTNPPSWVSDEEVWSRAKEAAAQTYDEGDDAYWPAVVHIYGNMGGSISSKKAMHAHADMADVVEMMSEYEMSDADMAEASGLDSARVKALLHGGEKPTDAELTAMTEACEECADESDDMKKHAEHDQSSHGDRGFSSTSTTAGNIADQREEKYPTASSHLRDAQKLLREAHEHEIKGDKSKVKELSRRAMRGLRGARNAFRGTGTGEDESIERMMADIKEYTASIVKSITSESLLKAELGMSDGEFRRMLSQAVYARWGKQAAVDELYGDCDVVIVKVWEGDAWVSGCRIMRVPFDREHGVVTLGEVNGEVRQTYEPVAKSEHEPDDSPCEVEYVADRDKRGEYVISGLNGEAVTLAKSLSDAGVQARAENLGDGAHRVVFASRGATCKQLAVRATVDGEFESEPRSFVPYLRNEVLIQKAEEKGIVYAVVYEPDVVDKQGEWATAEDIEEAAHDYLRKSRRMKRQHDEHSDSEVVESYIAQADFFLGNRMVRKGSWVIAVKLGETAKKLYKAGKLQGVSMGGHASYVA